MQANSMSNDWAAQMRRALELMNLHRFSEADQICKTILEINAGVTDAWVIRARIAQRRNLPADMLALARQAFKSAPGHLGSAFLVVEALTLCGERAEARSSLQKIEAKAGKDARLLQHIAEFHTHSGAHEGARRCLQRAGEIEPRNPHCLYNLAASLIALGDMAQAEIYLDRVIALDSHDYDAYYNRATLRRQTVAGNHVKEMTAVLQAGVKHPAGEAGLCYALAKELEDLGDYRKSFEFLQRGAEARRKLLSYRVEDDIAAIDEIRKTFDKSLFQKAAQGHDEAGPIFILGLPRSGTTLVDRIISSHSEVESLGEINDFALSLMRLAGNLPDKMALIRRAAALDFRSLGKAYTDSTRGYERRRTYFIDKTPLNYLYIGLIHLALPNARIIHMRRDPMDSAYAMYKTLFRMGYPFSYDLSDIARYYAAYEGLMAHWRSLLPGRFLDVDYEDLVENQEAVSRRIISHCGLDWEDACLRFHDNSSPAPTASAAQVRQPIYKSSLQLWRRYEQELQPLVQMLRDHGVTVDTNKCAS